MVEKGWNNEEYITIGGHLRIQRLGGEWLATAHQDFNDTENTNDDVRLKTVLETDVDVYLLLIALGLL